MALFSHLNALGIYFALRNKVGLQFYFPFPPLSINLFCLLSIYTLVISFFPMDLKCHFYLIMHT